MANERERQPELDYYELRRRRQQVLARREKERPEWDPSPVRRSAAPADKPAVKKVVAGGEEVFPPKPVIEIPVQEKAETVKPVQPKNAPLVRNPIQVEVPDELPEQETYQPRHAAVEPEIETVAAEPAADEAAYDEVLAEDVYDEYDDGEFIGDDDDAAYDGELDDDMVDEEVGNNPFTPIVKVAGNLAGRFSEWKQSRAQKAEEEPQTRKRGLKALFGRKQAAEEEIAEETEVDWDEFPAEEEPLEETFAEESIAEEPLADIGEEEIPAEEIPAEEIPAEEIPAEEIPAEEAPVEEIADIAEDEAAEEIAEDVTGEEFTEETEEVAFEEEQPKKKFSLKNLFAKKKKEAEPAADEQSVWAPDADEAAAEEPAEETPLEEPVIDEPAAEEIAEDGEEFIGETEEVAFEEEQPKKKFSLKGLFGKKQKASDDDLLAMLDDFDDLDDDDLTDLDDEDFDDEADFDGEPEEIDEQPADEDIPAEEAFAEEIPEAEETYEIMEEPAEEIIEEIAEEPEEAPIALDEEAPIALIDEEIPAEEIAVDEPSDEVDGFLPFDDEDEEFEDEEEEEPAPRKRGLFGFLRRGPKKRSDDDLLALLGDDEDDDEEDEEDWEDFLDSDMNAERSDEDMDNKNLIASQMADGIGERTLTRKERRELAERQAAAAAQAAEVQEEVQAAAEEIEEEVEEPTRAFTPVRAARETAPAEADDYDAFEEEEEPAPRKKGMFSRKAKKAVEEDDLDDLIFGDEDEKPAKKAKKPSRDEEEYDDYDDEYDDDEDEYDDDEDYDDFDDFDDDEEGGGFFSGLIRGLFTIVVIIAAAVIILNLLASRNIGPAQKAVDTIGDLLPVSISEKIFPGYETDGEIEGMVQPVVDVTSEAVEDVQTESEPVAEPADPEVTRAPANE